MWTSNNKIIKTTEKVKIMAFVIQNNNIVAYFEHQNCIKIYVEFLVYMQLLIR